MDCPCEMCLVKSICSNKLIEERILTENIKLYYLSMKTVKNCPLLLDYFGKDSDGKVMFDYDKVRVMCNIFGIVNLKYIIHTNSDRKILLAGGLNEN